MEQKAKTAAKSAEPKSDQSIRPTKKQKELLSFIETFIAQHGYSPSYREIMRGLGYTSVATVALHINSLVKRGHLIKREHLARSLEPTKPAIDLSGAKIVPKQLKASEEKWLVQKVEAHFKDVEGLTGVTEAQIDQLQVLVGALKVLGLDGASSSFGTRLNKLKSAHQDNQYVA